MSRYSISTYENKRDKKGSNTKFPIYFKPYDGYYPLIMLNMQYGNHIFAGSSGVYGRIRNNISLNFAGRNIRYKRRRGKIPIDIYSGFFTALANNSGFTSSSSDLIHTSDTKHRIDGITDVFCLGVVKVSNLPIITIHKRTFNSNIFFDIDLSSLKILVSKEKLRRTAFTNENYSRTVRTEILKCLDSFRSRHEEISIEDVSEDYMESFIVSSKCIKTNSISKIVQIDNEIKNSVFTKLNEIAI